MRAHARSCLADCACAVSEIDDISLKLRGGGTSQVACFQQLLSATTVQEVVHVTALQDVCTHARQGKLPYLTRTCVRVHGGASAVSYSNDMPRKKVPPCHNVKRHILHALYIV